MKTTLEYNGRPAELSKIPPTATMLTICAWCDPEKVLAQKLTAAGYKLTHGVCDKHREDFYKKMNHTC